LVWEGGFYAFILGRNENVSLSVVARSNYEAVKKNGLKIQSENHGEHEVKIANVYQNPSDAAIKFDYIVCAHKAINPESAPPLFKDVAHENTTFVIIQNGVGNEDPFRKVYPKSTIISCVTWVEGIQKTPGTITHTKNEATQMGLFPNPDLDPKLEQSRLEGFAALLRNGGTSFSIEDDIQIQRWEKVVFNCTWNAITTLTGIDTQTWLKSSPEAMLMSRRLMEDVIDVAKRCNARVDYELVDMLMDRILAMNGVYSSTYRDMKAGRPLEIDVIIGTPMRKAREFGMEVPVLSTMYALTAAVDQRLREHKE